MRINREVKTYCFSSTDKSIINLKRERRHQACIQKKGTMNFRPLPITCFRALHAARNDPRRASCDDRGLKTMLQLSSENVLVLLLLSMCRIRCSCERALTKVQRIKLTSDFLKKKLLHSLHFYLIENPFWGFFGPTQKHREA